MEAVTQAENERYAHLLTAINFGNHGKPNDLKREINRLTNAPKPKSMSVEDALKMGKKLL